jgi:hypothetical protein
MTNAELRAALAAALAALDAMTPVVDQTYPKPVTHNGVQYMLQAPLPATFENSIAAITFGRPPSIVRDPSNAPAGYPFRSAAGWPLSYAIGANGAVVGEPRMICGDQTFGSDQEVAEYAARVLQVAALRAKGGTSDNPRVVVGSAGQANTIHSNGPPVAPVDVPIGIE